MSFEEPFLEKILGDPESKARWIYRLRIAYILWIIFVILGLLSIALYYMLC